jgi:hypothetical protein
LSVTSNVSATHKLVVGSEAQLTFAFVAAADFPSTNATELFGLNGLNGLKVNGTQTPALLTSAVVSTTARTVRVAYTATTTDSVSFEFATSYGTKYTFTVTGPEVYTFPTMSATTRGTSVVSLNQSLTLTSAFSAALPSGTTATVSVVPTGQTALAPAATVAGSNVTYSVVVAHDVVHTGTVTLAYGAVQRAYAWASGTLTSAQIYTFPTVSAVLALNGATTGSDYNVLGFAAGRAYGSATSTGSTVTLALGSVDADTPNTTAVAATGAVELYVGNTLVVGGVAAYTYTAGTQTIAVTSMTLGSTTGSLEFRVRITAPSGATRVIETSGHAVYAVPNTVSVATIAGGDTYKLVASSATNTRISFSHTVSEINTALGAVASAFSSGASTGLLTVQSTPSVPVSLESTFTATGVLGAEITATTAQQTLTFTFSPTRTSISCVIAPTEIYAFPSSFTHTVVALSGLSKVDINQQATCTVSVVGGSALVPTGTTHALTVPAGQTTIWSVVEAVDASPMGARNDKIRYRIKPLRFPSAETTASLTLGFAGLARSYTLTNVLTASTVTSGWENVPSPPTNGLQVYVLATAPIISEVSQNLAAPSSNGTRLYTSRVTVDYASGKVAFICRPVDPNSGYSWYALSLPSVTARTISIMFNVSTVPSTLKYPYLINPTGSGLWIIPRTGNIGPGFNGAVAYLNGNPGRPLSECMEPFRQVSSSWQSLTIVMQASQDVSLIMDDMDINIGRWLVYNRALSEAECRAL